MVPFWTPVSPLERLRRRRSGHSLPKRLIIGQQPSEELFRRAGEVGVGMCSPITDHRGTMEYRCMMIEVLTRKSLQASLEQARSLEALDREALGTLIPGR